MKKLKTTLKLKIDANNLQEVLIVLVIIGIIAMLAIVNYTPAISKAKSIEAQTQLKYIFNLQTSYRYMYSTYSSDLYNIDFIAPKTVNENGTSNYVYDIMHASNNSFKVRATAISDFNGNGVFNIWEIDENGKPKQTIKD